MSFPKDSYLIFLPNNYIWIKALMEYAAQEYGALATALLDEDKISFDSVVSKIPTSTLLQYQVNPNLIPPVPPVTTGNESKDEASSPSSPEPLPFLLLDHLPGCQRRS
jgi:hypothetical protein